MSLEPKGSAVSRNKLKKQESSVHTPPHTRRIHVCMHVLYVCMYSMYVLYVCALCLHSIYVLYVCTLCMYSMYVLYVCTLCMCREQAFQQIAEAAVRAVWAHERVAPTPIAASSSSFSGPDWDTTMYFRARRSASAGPEEPTSRETASNRRF